MSSKVYNGNMNKQEEDPIRRSPSSCLQLIAHIPSRLLIPSLLPVLNGSTLKYHNHSSINHLRPPLSDNPTRASSSTALCAVPWTRRTVRIVYMRGSCRFGDIDYLALSRSDCSLFNDDWGVGATAETHFHVRLMPNDALNVENKTMVCMIVLMMKSCSR